MQSFPPSSTLMNGATGSDITRSSFPDLARQTRAPAARASSITNLGTTSAPSSSTPVANTRNAEDGLIVVGEGTYVAGDLKNCNRVEVYGEVEGSISTVTLIVGEKGVVKGVIETDTAEVRGRLEGKIFVHEHLSVAASGIANGDIVYAMLSIVQGGELLGTLECKRAVTDHTSKPTVLGDQH